MAKSIKKPAVGEQTKNQSIGDSSSSYGQSGFTHSPGTYKLYRRMKSSPTIYLAETAAKASIRANQWSVEGEDAPSGSKDFIDKQMVRLWPNLIKDVMLSLDYGWQGFEKVWDVVDGAYVYKRLKPLMPDNTEPLVDKQTGYFAGLKQEKIELPPENSFVFTNESEYDDVYGKARHEAVRKVFCYYEQLIDKMGVYGTKVAGVIPMIEYPEGRSVDKSGAEVDNFEIAQRVLRDLSLAKGVLMPNTLSAFAQDLARSGVDIGKLKAWQIGFLESGGSHGSELVEMLRHFETLQVRGWLFPERSILEGQHGTNAEAETQSDWALIINNQLFSDILEAVNYGVVDPLMYYNYGPETVGLVRLGAGGVSPDTKNLIREMLLQIFTNPANADLLLSVLNIDSMIDTAGIPRQESAEKMIEVNADKQAESERNKQEPLKEEERKTLDKAMKRVE